MDAREILKYIRHVYFALHRGTEAAPTYFTESTGDLAWVLDERSLYPLCSPPGHHGDSTLHVNKVITPSAVARSVLRDNIPRVPASPVSAHDSPSSSLPAPLRVDKNIKDVPPLDNHTPAPESSRLAHPRTVKDRHIPASPPDPTTSNAT